jgi:glycosyltransferase involved in cell wall biosynthesis
MGPYLGARAARRAGVHLSIIGDGPMLESLRGEFLDVSFTGRLAPQDIGQRVRSARALVMPSRYPEPYGLVAVEALWSGIPVVLAESALLARDVVNRGAGLSCDPLNEVALAEAMSRIVSDNALARNMSISAFEETRDLGLPPEGWADQLLRVFEELLDGVRPAASAA